MQKAASVSGFSDSEAAFFVLFHESQSLKGEVLTKETKENPNGFYGDSKLQAELGLQDANLKPLRVFSSYS